MAIFNYVAGWNDDFLILPMSSNNTPPVPVRLLLNPVHFLSLGFGSGLSPWMPGTAGSVVGVLLFLLLAGLDWPGYLLIVVLALIAGIYLCDATARALKAHDHPAIVWDEIVGILITFFMLPKGAVWLLVGFLLFRLFDIAKPWPISLVDRHVGGGLGIMLDDVIAALFALLIIQISLYLL